MGNKSTTSKIEIYTFVLLSIGQYIILSVGGELTLTTIFITATSFLWINKIDFNDPKTRKIFVLYGLLLLIQIVCEARSTVSMGNKLKGIAITVNSLITYSYFYYRFQKDLGLIKYYFLGITIARILFPNVLSEIAGGEFGYYKFTFVPFVASALITLTLFAPVRYITKLPLMICYSGAIFIITGARSSGGMLLLVGIVGFAIFSHRIGSTRAVYKMMALVTMVLYAAYALLYIPMVLDGKLDGVGNSEQLKSVRNPYNPLNLLVVGRTDSIIPFLALMERPLTGWGYRADDPGMKFHQMIYMMKGEDLPDNYEITEAIPAHSVIGGYAVAYGVGGLILLATMFLTVVAMAIERIFDRSRYTLLLLYVLFNILWHAPFSPMPHFKTSIPIMMALIVAISTNYDMYIKKLHNR